MVKTKQLSQLPYGLGGRIKLGLVLLGDAHVTKSGNFKSLEKLVYQNPRIKVAPLLPLVSVRKVPGTATIDQAVSVYFWALHLAGVQTVFTSTKRRYCRIEFSSLVSSASENVLC